MRQDGTWRSKKLGAFLAIGAVLAAQIEAGEPLPGEQRFNAAIYKGSHNSYARNESLAAQIDDYNIWQIELDVYDIEGQLWVSHEGEDLSRADTLSTLLQKMHSESKTFSRRFTLLYVDMKGGDWTDQTRDRLKNVFAAALNGDRIYPSAKFVGEDQSRWPSYRELVRRGV